MITLRFDQLVRMTAGTLYNTEHVSREFCGVSIDSRALRSGELFIALKGEHNDGHEFIPQAIDRGAAGVLAQRGHPRLHHVSGEVPVVAVTNSYEAMVSLATQFRDRVSPVRVGISGSNGKTTTKEYTYSLCSAVTQQVYRSPGNFNNLYGMPLALLAMPQDTRVAVLEMGISVPGEMEQLAAMVKPDVMVITNVGPSHLQSLGSVTAVAQAKLEAVTRMSSDQPVIINADDEILVRETTRIRKNYIGFGLESKAGFRPENIKKHDSGDSIVTIDGHNFRLFTFGRYQIYNLLAAYTIVRTLGYTFDNVDTESLILQTAPMRGEVMKIRGVTFVVDCYNANPDSVKQGLRTFSEQEGHKRRLIILGDMLELGESSQRCHREIGQMLGTMLFDYAAMVGPMTRYAVDEACAAGVSAGKIEHFDTAADCAGRLVEMLSEGDIVYVKGSRGIGLETVVQGWQAAKGDY